MIVAMLDDLRARNSGFRQRTRDELHHDLTAACASLGALADHGTVDHHLVGIERTLEGMRRLLVDLRTGGNPNAA